ncbi:MAG: helix-turn-helix domain-containing protein [Candidatus Aenigmarchaeota archaeon]|nr:helix-turn-helix domain-containing protein [Candidatus Aenigmarchaeota archaeon]
MLLQRVEKILEKGGFDYCEYNGCFDIAATKRFTFFLKVLDNVDSFQESQANNLKIISKDLDVTISLIGTHTRREFLQDNIIYDRFSVPTLTPNTLEKIIVNGAMPTIYRFRGGLFTEVDAAKLRKNREASGLSQSQLAEKVGVTKKNIYEHERENKNASLNMVKKIEEAIGEVTNPVPLQKKYPFEKNKPHDRFEFVVSKDLEKIGFDTDLIYQTPFNIVAHEKKMLIMSKADDNKRKVEKMAPFMSQLSHVTKIPAVAITKEELDIDIPSISEKELKDMKIKDLKKFIK